MLKYIVLVSFSTGVVCAADFMTGQAARAVIGQPNFTSQITGLPTDTTTNGVTTRTYSGFTNSIFGTLGGLAYANNTLFATDSNRIGLQPANDRVVVFNNLNQMIPAANQDIQPFTGRCPVCGGTAATILGDIDSNGSPLPITPNSNGIIVPPVTRTGFRQPTAVASNGQILAVADTANNRVLIWNSIPQTWRTPADLVLGQPDFTTVAPLTITASTFRGPQGVWIQGNQLYVADTQNNRVLVWNSIPTRNNQPADMVLGQPNFTTAPVVNQINLSLPATSNTMLSPVSVTSDGQRLIVADLGFSRVLIWNRLPTQTQQAADVEIGQVDFTQSISNDVTHLCTSLFVDSVVNTSGTSVTWVSGATFPSTLTNAVIVINGVTYGVASWDSGTSLTLKFSAGVQNGVNSTAYPGRCAATLDFPRYALSDGKRLYIADGGNDRVLVFNNIPSQNSTNPPLRADAILGQPDEFSATYSASTPVVISASDSTPTPTSLAWDGANLYVADPSNYRILVFSPQDANKLPVSGVVNAASRQVFASGSFTVGGTIKVEDTITATINGQPYKYTVKTGDTTDSIAKAITTLINNFNNGVGDPNVFATEQTGQSIIRLFARQPGPDGNKISLATATSTNATETIAASSSQLNGGASAAQVSPGALVIIRGTELAEATATAQALDKPLPYELGGVQVYFDGQRAPIYSVVNTSVNGKTQTEIGTQVPWPSFGSNSLSAWVRTKRADGSVTVTDAIGIPVLNQNPGIFACNPVTYNASPTADPTKCDPGGQEPRALVALHGSDFATGTVSIDGSIQGGDVAQINIGGVPYKYVIQAGDTLASVRDGLIQVINADPNAVVTAAATGAFTRVRLTAKVPGIFGSGYALSASGGSVSNSANVSSGIAVTATSSRICCFSVKGAGQPVTVNNPAIPGETIAFYGAGLGLIAPERARLALVTGAPYTGPNNSPRSDVSVTIGGITANLISESLKQGTVALYEMVVEMGPGVTANPQAQVTISQDVSTSNIATIPIATPSALTFQITPDSFTIAKGTAMNFTVTAVDAFQNPVQSYSGTLHVTSSDGAATLPTDTTTAGGTGILPVTFNTTGQQTITVTDTVTGLTLTSPPITVQ